MRTLSRRIGCHPVTATVLANRGFDGQSDMSAFLHPALGHIHSFDALKDMDKAVDRIARAIAGEEKILVFGDYDVDGVTATTILYQFLQQAGADVDCYIPHRTEEGYGLKTEHIETVAIARQIDLIITTDCGAGSCEAVRAARAAGIGVVITDHHDIDELPEADAVVNPKRSDCRAGLEHLAGVGVAFYLLICLRKALRERGVWPDGGEPNLKAVCDLVALGTVADIVPLIRENRVIVKTGLAVLNESARPGIRALLEVCGLQKPRIDTDDLAFRLAPRLNAAGRMDHAMQAVRLLTTRDPAEAASIAEAVNALNARRQTVENQIMQGIKLFLENEPEMLTGKSLVLASEQWHQGVLGIVASRLVETYFRPVILFTIENGVGVGSARSIPGIDLYDSLHACHPYLETYGGHAMAAGLRVKCDQIDPLRRALDARICQNYCETVFEPQLKIDCELNFDMISESLVDEIESLQPFGADNPEPLFFANDVQVLFSKIVGRFHRRMIVCQPGSKTDKRFVAMCFNIDPQQSQPNRFFRMAFRLRWNYYNGSKTIQLIVEETQAD
ncbi:MAG: single-stranded-DNA-specific exonuclease RecJ [Thermodesulfobacteriota bacterium]